MKLTPLRKLVVVIAIQALILLSLIGFRQYTLLTRDTVMLLALSADTSAPAVDGQIVVRYEISRIDLDDVAGDDELWEVAFVELEEGEDGYWHAVAIHGGHEREFDDTVLIKGTVTRGYAGPHTTTEIEYGIEQVDIGDTAAADIPWGEKGIAVKVKVDRYGNSEAEDGLYADGERLDAQSD